jgi:tetratricopeptide (TPR) repeat protein
MLKSVDDILAAERNTADEAQLAEVQRVWDTRILSEQPAVPEKALEEPNFGDVTEAPNRTHTPVAAETAPPAAPVAAGASRRGMVIGAAALAVVALAVVFYATSDLSADEYATRGDDNRRKGELDRAIADYTEAIRLYTKADPRQQKLISVYCSRGEMFRARREYASAIADYTSALRIDSRSERALMDRADALRARGDREPALADFAEAIRINPGNDLAWVKRGDDEQGQGNLAEALQLFADNVTIFQRMVRAEPANTRWQRDLSVSYHKVGRTLKEQDKLSDALQAYRDSLAIARALVAKDGGNNQWLDDWKSTVTSIGGISYLLVLKRDFSKALDAGNQATSLLPKEIWMYSNVAHALMFLGRVQNARSLYLKYRGEKDVQNGNSWETVILNDFKEMRQAGLTHPLMDEIERRFRAGG